MKLLLIFLIPVLIFSAQTIEIPVNNLYIFHSLNVSNNRINVLTQEDSIIFRQYDQSTFELLTRNSVALGGSGDYNYICSSANSVLYTYLKSTVYGKYSNYGLLNYSGGIVQAPHLLKFDNDDVQIWQVINPNDSLFLLSGNTLYDNKVFLQQISETGNTVDSIEIATESYPYSNILYVYSDYNQPTGKYVTVWSIFTDDSTFLRFALFDDSFNHVTNPITLEKYKIGLQKLALYGVRWVNDTVFSVIHHDEFRLAQSDSVFYQSWNLSGEQITPPTLIRDDVSKIQSFCVDACFDDQSSEWIVTWVDEQGGNLHFQRLTSDGERIGENTDVDIPQVSKIYFIRTDCEGDSLFCTWSGWNEEIEDYLYLTVFNPENPESINEPAHTIADQYNLLSVYPNPFNPTTTITWNLNENSDVVLKIFNISGECVFSKIWDNQIPGSYHYVWEASNLATGIYFIQLRTMADIRNIKVVLVK